MAWIELTKIKINQEWQYTPVIPSQLGYVRLSFATSGIPITIAQVDSITRDFTDQRRIVASGNSQILTFECPPFFNERSLALKLPDFYSSFEIKIEVNDMAIFRGSVPTVNLPSASTVNATSVAASITSVQLLAANSNRKMASFTNTGTGILYLELGSTASTTAYTVALNQNDVYELPVAYTGVVSGLWSSTNGSCLVREFI